MNYGTLLAITSLLTSVQGGCEPVIFKPSNDEIQRNQSEQLFVEASAQVGMPAIRNFRERKLVKDILEMRDQTGLMTYTYLWSDVQGKLVFLCESIGYAVPYSVQFINPAKRELYTQIILPQADPNGLFSPASSEGKWVMCRDPRGPEAKPMYVEPRIVTSLWPLPSLDTP